MRLLLSEINEEGAELRFEEPKEAFPVLTEMVRNQECDFLRPITCRMRVYRVGDMIEAEGELETLLSLNCSRCLESYGEPVRASFAVTFVRELPEVEDESGEGVELSAEELGLILVEGDYLDLAHVVEEQIVLSMPLHPLCSEDCKGLCPHCGALREEGGCDCESPPFDTRFAALRGLKVDKKNDD